MSIKINFKDLVEELKNVRTIELACITANVLEKILWTILGVLGVAWAFYLIPSNFQIWLENPSIISKGEFVLSDIKYPAISIKSSGIAKYNIAERLANYIKPDKLPLELKKARILLLKCVTIEDQEYEVKSDKHYFTTFQDLCLFNFQMHDWEEGICEVMNLLSQIQTYGICFKMF